MLRRLILGRFLEDGETISKAFRQPFPFSKFLFYFTIFGAIIYGIYWYNYNFHIPMLIAALVGFVKLKTIFFRWYTKAILMTSESLLFTDWDIFTSPRSIRLDYWDLDGIEVVREGAGAWIGNYGDLNFGKISGGAPITFYRASRPNRVEIIISANKEKMVDEKNFTEQSALKDLISQMVDYHVRKNGQPSRKTKEQIEQLSDLSNPLLANLLEETAPQNLDQPENVKAKETRLRKMLARLIAKKQKQPEKFESLHIEVEKELDDEGGISIDL